MEGYPENYIKQLEHLLRIANEGKRGYREAIEHVHSDHLKELFLRNAKEREQIAEELKERIRSLGGSPHNENTDTEGIVHHIVMAIKTAFTKDEKEDQVLLESCRSGDLAALDVYDEILQGSVLEKPGLKSFIVKQRLKISEALNEIEKLYLTRFKTNPEM